MKPPKRRLIREILKKIAPEIGATINMEPQWNIAGQIIFRNNKKCYFKYSSLDLNPLGSSEIAKDKDYSSYFMKSMGYPSIPGKTFLSDQWGKVIGCTDRGIDAGIDYAVQIGFPVIVKPNSGSQGLGVFKVSDRKSLINAMRFIFKWDRVALIQKPVIGNDYRIVVLDENIISAYQRIPLNITGDGHLTIRQLIKKKQAMFDKQGRDTRIKTTDIRIKKKLEEQNLTMTSVLEQDQTIFLLDNANLSSGGDSIDVTKNIHSEFERIIICLVKDMGLRLCGVDLIVNGHISEAPNKYWVLEINSSPGLDHYVKSGREQEIIVEAMYMEILKAMEKSSEPITRKLIAS